MRKWILWECGQKWTIFDPCDGLGKSAVKMEGPGLTGLYKWWDSAVSWAEKLLQGRKKDVSLHFMHMFEILWSTYIHTESRIWVLERRKEFRFWRRQDFSLISPLEFISWVYFISVHSFQIVSYYYCVCMSWAHLEVQGCLCGVGSHPSTFVRVQRIILSLQASMVSAFSTEPTCQPSF